MDDNILVPEECTFCQTKTSDLEPFRSRIYGDVKFDKDNWYEFLCPYCRSTTAYRMHDGEAKNTIRMIGALLNVLERRLKNGR